MRVLALDPGEKRVGYAFGISSEDYAQEQGTIERASLFASLVEWQKLYGFEAIVLGLPLEASGRSGLAAARAKMLAKKIEEYLHIQVFLLDERFTTMLANKSMLAAGVSARDRRAKIDARAAELLLQTYFASLASNGK